MPNQRRTTKRKEDWHDKTTFLYQVRAQNPSKLQTDDQQGRIGYAPVQAPAKTSGKDQGQDQVSMNNPGLVLTSANNNCACCL